MNAATPVIPAISRLTQILTPCALLAISVFSLALADNTADTITVFDESLAPGAEWRPNPPRDGSLKAEGGFESNVWLYLRRSDSPTNISTLDIPIREQPAAGEARYLSFAWKKWGGEPIAIQFERDPSADGEMRQGRNFDYRLYGGTTPPPDGRGLQIADSVGGSWQNITIDLWNIFGDFTINGIKLSVYSRDAGFDAIRLARNPGDFPHPVALQQTPVTEPVAPAPATTTEKPPPITTGAQENLSQSVDIDWAAQIKAGGWMMYPLYFCGLAAIVIAIQRFITVRSHSIAPEKVRDELRKGIARQDLEACLRSCSDHPSTLSDALSFILRHKHADVETISRSAADIASRDIRGHLSKIYPISVIASIAPLLGLLGTIIGMIEAFGLVALYGDEGGAAILSDSISKALITTAAGLIIAAPCIAAYHLLKNRIMTLASIIEVELENLVASLFLTPPAPPEAQDT